MTTNWKETETAGAADHSHTLIRETLLQIARTRGCLDPRAGSALFSMVETAGAVRRHLLSAVTEVGLTEAKLGGLVVLHRLDPETLTAADLAYHTGVSRSAMTEIVDQMVGQGWVERERALDDRRTVRIGLTTTGREMAERSIGVFMAATAALLDAVPKAAVPVVAEWCGALRERLEHSSEGAARDSRPRQ